MSAQRVLDAIEKLEAAQLLLEQVHDFVDQGACDTSNPASATKSLSRNLSAIKALVAEALEKIGD